MVISKNLVFFPIFDIKSTILTSGSNAGLVFPLGEVFFSLAEPREKKTTSGKNKSLFSLGKKLLVGAHYYKVLDRLVKILNYSSC